MAYWKLCPICKVLLHWVVGWLVKSCFYGWFYPVFSLTKSLTIFLQFLKD